MPNLKINKNHKKEKKETKNKFKINKVYKLIRV